MHIFVYVCVSHPVCFFVDRFALPARLLLVSRAHVPKSHPLLLLSCAGAPTLITLRLDVFDRLTALKELHMPRHHKLSTTLMEHDWSLSLSRLRLLCVGCKDCGASTTMLGE